VKRRAASALVLGALLLLAGSGCRGQGKHEESPLRIGVAVYKGDDTYISNMTAAMQESVEAWSKENGERVYLTISDAGESQTTQNEQIDRFLSLDYDVLCVNLVDRTDAAHVIDKARSADVPVVFFNREPVQEDLQTWDKVYYVGSDARQSAQLQAQIVLDKWEEDPASLDLNGDGVLQYVMLEGESRHQDAMIRTEVSVQALKDGGIPLERVDGGIANWDRNQAAALTEGYFERYPDLELILCNNDDMALGAADAVERLSMDFHNIVGIDGTPQGLEAVREERLLGTVVMDYAAHGETIFRLARALALNETPEEAAEIKDQTALIPMHMQKSW